MISGCTWMLGGNRWKKRRGAISLLLITITMSLVLVLSTSLSIVRMRADEVRLIRAMRSQLQASLSGYDPDLFNQFGLFGMKAESFDTDIYQEMLPDRYAGQAVNLSMTQSVFDPDVLEKQISRTMKLRLPMIWFTGLSAKARNVQIDAINTVDDLSTSTGLTTAAELLNGPLKPALDLLQNELIEALVSGLTDQVEPELKLQLTNIMESLDDVGDWRSSFADSIDSVGLLSQISQVIDSANSNPDSELFRRIAPAEYCLAYMTRAVTVHRDQGSPESIQTVSGLSIEELAKNRPAEIEQIITGDSSPERAVFQVKLMVIALRSLINLADILTDSAAMARLRTTAVAMGAAISAASGLTVNIDPELLAHLLAVGEAIRLGHQDYQALSRGDAVALLPTGISDLEIDLTYQDYLRLMLLIMPPQELLQRISQCIRTALPDDYAHAIQIHVMVRDSIFARSPDNGRTIDLELAYDD